MINIRCEFCKTNLHPLLLKQAVKTEDGMLYDIECINPECREHNWVNEEFYLHIRDDYLKPFVPAINNKMPSELNVMIVSMSRSGISWIVRELSMLHKRMFGVPIPLNAEGVSPVQATRVRFPVYKGWSNVYDVNPLDVLKTKDNGEKYDRVLIVKRKLKTIMTVHEIYYPDYLSEDQKVIWREKDKEMYKTVLCQEIDDPRCMTVNLEDLNNYTVDTFNELMDFFNFPEHTQPVIAPILSPERNSEAYSSILKKGQPLIERLNTIASFYELTLDGLLQLKNEKQRLRDLRYKNVKPPKLKDILVIGPKIHKGCHFSENIYYALKQKGYNVKILGLEELGYYKEEGKRYKSHKELYLISKAIDVVDFNPELIIMDEPAWLFYNDVDIPVFYVHREFKRPPKCFYPDVAFFWHEGILTFFKNKFAQYWCNQVPQFEIIGIAVDEELYKPKKKTIKGIVSVAGREQVSTCVSQELVALGFIHDIMDQYNKAIALGIDVISDEGGQLSDERFRNDILPKCEGIWIHVPYGQYVSRRFIQAMLCETICAIRIENQDHEDVLRKMGLNPGEHYIPIKDVEDVVELNKTFKYENYIDMAQKARKVILENHTYKHKADFLVDCYKKWKLHHSVVIVE